MKITRRKLKIRLHNERALRADRQKPLEAPTISSDHKPLDASTNTSTETPDKPLEALI